MKSKDNKGIVCDYCAANVNEEQFTYWSYDAEGISKDLCNGCMDKLKQKMTESFAKNKLGCAITALNGSLHPATFTKVHVNWTNATIIANKKLAVVNTSEAIEVKIILSENLL